MPYDGPLSGRTAMPDRCLDLIERLRARDRWPAGFDWDFDNCDRCAMGMAMHTYGGRYFNLDLPRPYSFPDLVEKLVGIGGEAANGLFRVPATRGGEAIPGDRIEPVHVADALERYLATGEVYYAL